jgi:tyrosyl-tRNA synthetase
VRPPVDEQVRALMFGSAYGDDALAATMAHELAERLRAAETTRRPLRVYAGYDPTRPDLHLGHAITLRKLRQFQDFGHHAIFVVGTFTAQVGDTSDKATGRPRLDPEAVFAAARTYAEQAFAVLDREKTTVAYNHEWLSQLGMTDVVQLASHFTVQQFLARDTIRKRLDAGNPVGLHEFLYALLQGYDAVHLRADVQLGATEQLFNILAGRKLQQAYGQPPCICITFPVLVGLDGRLRMSKSTGNTIGLTEPPDEQYGKTMSISDETMLEWIRYVTRWPVDQIEERTRAVRAGRLHPMELKKALAHEIVAMYHGEAAADAAAARFASVHQARRAPDDALPLELPGPTPIVDVLTRLEGIRSRGEARRLIAGRGVKLDGAVVQDPELVVRDAGLLQVGKRRFVSLRLTPG